MATIEYFLIAGATGRQGGAAVDALLTHPNIEINPSMGEQRHWARGI